MSLNEAKVQADQSVHDIFWMKKALILAKKAFLIGEVPVGAVIVLENQLVGEGFNNAIGTHDPSAHAEIQALRNAGKALDNYRLVNCDLYVTLEPCMMCAGAIIHSRIRRLIYAADEPKAGSVFSHMNALTLPQMNHSVALKRGLLKNDSSALLKQFFKEKREANLRF